MTDSPRQQPALSRQVLQFLQRLLFTAVTIVLALVVFTAFQRVIEPVEPIPLAEANAPTATTPGLGSDADEDSGSIPFVPPAADEATTNPLATGDGECAEEAPPTGAGTVLLLYYHCGGSNVPNTQTFVYRIVPATDLVLTTTLEQLVLGPDPDERASGFGSFFGDGTAGSFASVAINGGKATIDFVNLERIENRDAEGAADFLLANLNSNVFQFETISSVEYQLGGSCESFFALVGDECRTITRAQFDRQVDSWTTDG